MNAHVSVPTCLACVIAYLPYSHADEPKVTPRTMQVAVVDADGRPISKAEIHVSVWTKEPFKATRDFVCDDEGRTNFDLPNEIQILRLWAKKAGHVALFAQWWPEHEQAPRPIPDQFTFRLTRGTRISGLVKTEDGKPIAGAKVEVRLMDRRAELVSVEPIPNTWLSEGEDAVKTDGTGRWSLDNVPAGDAEVSLLLSHPDYVSDVKWGGLQNESDVDSKSLRTGDATIVMYRGIAVTGTVTNAKGEPVRDAIVVWGDDPYFQWGSQEVRTDEMGKYRLPPRHAGEGLTVTAIAVGYAPQQEKIAIPTQTFVNFQLATGKTLQIQFVDNTGAPVPGVGVGIESWRGNKALYNHKHPNVLDTKIPRQANGEGLFEWTWAPADAVSFTFYKEGFREVGGRVLSASEGPFAITLER
jgi:hypothetical protein